MAHVIIEDEQYIFRRESRNKLFILLGVGLVLLVLGVFSAMNPAASESEEHGSGTHHEVASTAQEHAAVAQEYAAQDAHAMAEEHEGPATWVKRIYTSLWMNNIFFLGLGIIGLFFVAIHYASQAGWSAGLIRVPLAMGNWIPIAGLLLILFYFLFGHTIFHWTHSDLYEQGPDYDEVLTGKSVYFFWPLAAGSFPIFFVFRMVLFLGTWYWFYLIIRKNLLAEDLETTTAYWYKNYGTSVKFLLFFAISSSMAAWDWIMSIDTHWFSTMFGWYTFASWWISGLAAISLICVYLKEAGYLRVVNANHLHDLGKYMFAFTIFWTYVWFAQFLLIWYANIPEESVYFVERVGTSPYSWIFYANLILNFVLPFLLLMTRDSKRQYAMLKVVCPILLVGHWLDFYNMITPGIMKEQGAVGLLEVGIALVFLAGFLLVVLSTMSRFPLVGKNHPTLAESLHHHI
jgi:hypothetical protein